MKGIISLFLLLAAFASSGCSLLAEYRPEKGAKPVAVVNDRGHIVGRQEILRANGERVLRVSLYTPRLDDAGVVIGYEERTRGGAIIRDLTGRHVGNRFNDLRSRGTNPGNAGVEVVFGGPSAPRERVSLAAAFIPSD